LTRKEERLFSLYTIFQSSDVLLWITFYKEGNDDPGEEDGKRHHWNGDIAKGMNITGKTARSDSAACPQIADLKNVDDVVKDGDSKTKKTKDKHLRAQKGAFCKRRSEKKDGNRENSEPLIPTENAWGVGKVILVDQASKRRADKDNAKNDSGVFGNPGSERTFYDDREYHSNDEEL
jgi:hypothetical protein